MFLTKRAAVTLLLVHSGASVLGGAGVAVVAVAYAPLPNALSAIAGLVIGTALTLWLMGKQRLRRWAHRRQRVGRWSLRTINWDLVELIVAVASMWLAAGAAAAILATV
ncbi:MULTISPECIES: hypothetical protein [unclassified Streptomyces]|uniref:hypothetical protein n=1 Tax=unclassified Streptomyces TaxID=2593676 RepID=UPI002DDAAC12|nr:hypothetical protein [Streptomyces sp. NBC_01762]WSC43028.1 hypothetical protein OIE61_03040 [Streptomyces sp. NBC_01762]